MKIIFGSWNRETDNNVYTPDNSGSGYENIAACLDGRWHVLSQKTKESYDLVLCCCPTGTDKIVKPDCWKKLILIEEAGFGVLNTHWFYEKLQDINFDGFLVHSSRLKPLFETLNRPVYDFCPPYPFERVQKIEKRQIVQNKICLNMSRLFTFESNIAGTIRLCQIMPDFQFVSYCNNVRELSPIIKKAGVNNWEIISHLGWFDYIEQASDCSMFASLDNRYTWGRFQLDAAALGKRCAGAYAESQILFYPEEFCVDATNVEKLADLIRENAGKEYQAPIETADKVSHKYFLQKISNIFKQKSD
jgi:hypothetical protein